MTAGKLIGADSLSTRAAVVAYLKRAAIRDPWRGQTYVEARHKLDTTSLLELGRPTRVMLTLDIGYHASGWWRNSQYDRCLHLSVSHPVLTDDGRIVDREACSEAECRAWAGLVFGEHVGWSWLEPAVGPLDVDVVAGRRLPGVWHARLFLDRFNRPILPEGEVSDLKPFADGSSPEKVFRS